MFPAFCSQRNANNQVHFSQDTSIFSVNWEPRAFRRRRRRQIRSRFGFFSETIRGRRRSQEAAATCRLWANSARLLCTMAAMHYGEIGRFFFLWAASSTVSRRKKVGEFSFLEEREGERWCSSSPFDFLFSHNWMNTYKKPTIGNGLFPPTKVIPFSVCEFL